MWPAQKEEAQDWIRQRLAGFAFDGRAGDIPWRVAGAKQRPAAVLVPLVWHEAGPTVLLTRRTESLSTHAGQVSFPGGKVDEGDSSVIAAALREAEEEIGLAQEQVVVLGTLPQYVTITDFVVTPVVAMLQPPLQLRPEPGEVAEVFEVPLALALDGRQYEKHSYVRDGVQGQYLAMQWQHYTIWGATAAMLRLLSQALQQAV
ncbi:MAG: CoA pyrophosphatase [Aquitalea sp.]|nr:CoA pyrophosphatase [Aquitalea sp.]